MSEEFDRWLEERLNPLRASAAPPPQPRYAMRRQVHPRWRLRLASVPAALGAKLLIGAGAVALAAAAGVGVKTAFTGNPNPLDWSSPPAVVQSCAASPAPSPGIGPCVSGHATASPLGAAHGRTAGATRPTPRASGKPTSPGKSQDHPTPPASPGKSQDHPTPPATPANSQDHPTPAASPGSSDHPTSPPHPTPTAGSGQDQSG